MFEKTNNLFKLIALLLVTAMLFGMTFTVSAYEMDEALYENWEFAGGAYAIRATSLIKVLDAEGKQVAKAEGMEARITDDGGIKLIGPAPEVKGDYPFYAVTSKNTTALDNLTVEIKLDEFHFGMDHMGVANRIAILWTEHEPADTITLDNPNMVVTNGIRYMIPHENGELGVPAAKGTEGRALYIEISNNKPGSGGAVATKVNIVYYDGKYINANDSHPGYRWTFGGRNVPGANGDSSGIVKDFENIDLTDGLKVVVKRDEEHGYIVNINGKDYYKGEDVANFPEAIAAGKAFEGLGEYHGLKDITDEDYVNLSDKYLASMTYAKDDIDLTGLVGAKAGYLTVGVTGVYDQYYPEFEGNITIERINGYKAAEWKGEKAPCDHKPGEWELILEPTCGTEGERVKYCKLCEEILEREAVPADETRHIEKYEFEPYPTCEHTGFKYKECALCGKRLDEGVEVPKTECAANKYECIKEAGCEENGIAVGKCIHCKRELKVAIPAKGHLYEEKILKEAGYGIEGVKAEVCKYCGATHNEEKLPPRYFTDVPEGAWYYEGVYHCAGKELMVGNDKEEFLPDGKLTREQFVVILARVAGAELEDYRTVKFADVKDGTWYAGAVAWAAEKGYVKGIGDGTRFGVGKAITRQELAVMLCRYAEAEGIKGKDEAVLDKYLDAARVAEWAKGEVAWAVEAELIGSVKTDRHELAPEMTVTRAQAAKIFMVFAELK